MVSPLATRAVNGESKKPANRGLFCASAVPVYRWRSRRLYYLQQAQRANLSTQGDDFYVFVKNFHKTTCKKSAMSLDFSNSDAGWSSLAARRAHNPKVVGSNPTPATKHQNQDVRSFCIFAFGSRSVEDSQHRRIKGLALLAGLFCFGRAL